MSVLPRASLGSETLNRLTRKSDTCLAVDRLLIGAIAFPRDASGLNRHDAGKGQQEHDERQADRDADAMAADELPRPIRGARGDRPRPVRD